MLITATSRPCRNSGERSAAVGPGAPRPPLLSPAAAGAGAAAAARAPPISQIPFTPRTAPTYSNTTASSIASLLNIVGDDRDLRRQCPESAHEGVGDVASFGIGRPRFSPTTRGSCALAFSADNARRAPAAST